MEKHTPKLGQGRFQNRFSPRPPEGPSQEPSHGPSPGPSEGAYLAFDYDVVCGRLLVTSVRGGFVIFHGVPIDVYIGLRFSPTPETYLRERLIGAFSFVCSSACWPTE